jgi:hypothetical protein
MTNTWGDPGHIQANQPALAKQIKYIAVHPYGDAGGPTSAGAMRNVTTVTAWKKVVGTDVVAIVTECGWATPPCTASGTVSEADQANFVIAQLERMEAEGVGAAMVYHLLGQDDANADKGNANSFNGAFHFDWKPKPLVAALRAFFAQRLPTPGPTPAPPVAKWPPIEGEEVKVKNAVNVKLPGTSSTVAIPAGWTGTAIRVGSGAVVVGFHARPGHLGGGVYTIALDDLAAA